MKKEAPDQKSRTFEEAIDRLEQIVSLLENGEAPLDDSIKLFEEGAGLAAFCDETLSKAEQKVREISEKTNVDTPTDAQKNGQPE